jgi:hypothetical protein
MLRLTKEQKKKLKSRNHGNRCHGNHDFSYFLGLFGRQKIPSLKNCTKELF